jgi:hypothetical protein
MTTVLFINDDVLQYRIIQLQLKSIEMFKLINYLMDNQQ